MRSAYRHALIDAETNGTAEPPNPFTNGEAAFASWLAGPAWPGSSVSLYVAELRAGRPHLRATFSQVPGADEEALLEWVAGKCGGELPAGPPTAAAL